MANPFLFLAPLNGSLAFRDRSGGGTLTGSGAVRYQAASGARTNLCKNPRGANDVTNWVSTGGGLTPLRIASDTPLGGTAIEISNNGNAFGGAEFYCGKIAGSGVALTISFDIYGVSGSLSNWQSAIIERNAAGTGLSTTNGDAFTNSAVSTSPTRLTVHVTPSTTGVDYIGVAFRNINASTGVIRVTNVVVETGTVTSPTYFDGSTGGAWLDPITGILGTAHASPSVSQAAAWVEEGTTNTVPDPSFENATITNYWTAQGTAAISKVTTHAYISSNGGKVVCGAATTDGIHQLATSGSAASSGQSWTVSGRIRAFAAGDVGKTVKAAIIERTSGDAVVTTNLGSAITLTDAWQVFSYTVALSGGGTVAKATCGFMAGAAVAVDFVLDAVQLEQKAYATSYCDGAIGTGYAWSGTAHASSSTRTACSISVDETNRIKPSAGAVALRINRTTTPFTASKHLFTAGSDASGTGFAGKDVLIIGLTVTSAFRPYSSWIINDGAEQAAIDTAAAPVVGTWADVYSQWNGTTFGVAQGVAALITGTRTTPQGDMDGVGNMTIGHGIQSAGSYPNVLIGPVAIANRPLTDRERTRLYSATTWTWNMLKSGFRHGKLV